MNLTRRLCVPDQGRFKIKDIDPDSTPGIAGKAAGERLLERNLKRIDELQFDLHAESRRSLLIVFQALDAGGKDGVIRQLATGLNPQGCQVTSFKVPSGEEATHDFLWRIHRQVPPRGEIGIFNRSHYEDVLVVRVHGLVPEAVWTQRYEQINAFERQLAEDGVRILKFFLHISRDEQKKRLLERLENTRKRWKFSAADLEERKRWADYMEAYQEALRRCSTRWAPWFAIPANHNWYRNAAVSQVVREALEDMKPKLPKPKLDPRRFHID